MYLLIVGSRSISEFDFTGLISKETDLIISGGATGIDTLAEKYADEHNISKLILRPKYHRYGKAAPIHRNDEMLGWADSVLVIWDGKSRGAKYTMDHAHELGKSVHVVLVEDSNKSE